MDDRVEYGRRAPVNRADLAFVFIETAAQGRYAGEDMTRSASVFAAIALGAGCAATPLRDVRPVLHHPWVEARALALTEETLTLTVRARAVEVDALCTFRPVSDVLDFQMTFPIPRPGGRAEDFAATLEGPGGVQRLPAW